MPEVDGKLQSVQVQLDEEVLDDITDWLQEELFRAKGDRQGLEEKVREWDRLYEAIPKEKEKQFPWPGASNLMIPTIATAVESVLARLVDSVFGANTLWVAQAKSAKWVDVVEPLDRFVNWAGKEVMHMYDICQRWFLGTIKYGTGVIKLPWVEQYRTVRYMDGDEIVSERITLHDGPKPEVIKLLDFYWSPDAVTSQDVQNCEWIAFRSVRTYKYLKEMENSGVYTNVEKLKEIHARSFPQDDEAQIEEQTGVQPSERKDYEIYEVWCSYDVTGEGDLSELVVTLHLESKTVLRAVYNFYRHQERPVHILRYMPRENSLLGIGICQMLEDVQTEITTLHNQRVDNATLSNTKAWKKRQGAVTDFDEVYPGVVVTVGDMEDVMPMDMGSKHDTLLQEEMHTNAVGEKRTGVSDYTVGRESSAIGSRATATSTLALIREGNKRFKMVIREIREKLSEIAHQTLMLYQQFAPDNQVMFEMFSEKEKRYVQQYLELPMEHTKENVFIDVPALSETENKEINQQSYLMLIGVTQQLYQSLMEAFMVALNPEAPEQVKKLASQGAETGATLFQRVLEAFDIKDAENLTPDVEQMLSLGASMEDLMAQMNQMSQLGGEGGTTQAPYQQGEGPVAGAEHGGVEPPLEVGAGGGPQPGAGGPGGVI